MGDGGQWLSLYGSAGSQMTKDWIQWRLDTALIKEPETIAFIDEISQGSTLLDVGANVGIFTVYAAERGINVIAVEPHYPTAQVLMDRVSGLKNVAVLPIALGESSRIAPVYYKDDAPGTSGHQIDAPVDESGKRYDPSRMINMPIFALDDIPGLPQPDFAKLDVDGHEFGVLVGGKPTNEKGKGILIETNPHSRNCIDLLLSWGFKFHDKLNNIPGHSRERRAKEPGNCAENWILTK